MKIIKTIPNFTTVLSKSLLAFSKIDYKYLYVAKYMSLK